MLTIHGHQVSFALEVIIMKTDGHPIRVVAKRTGLTPDVLRAWERRYSAITPFRSITGRRLYSDHDVSRLTLMKQIVAGGRRISDIANLSLADLQQVVNEDLDAQHGQLVAETANQVPLLDTQTRCMSTETLLQHCLEAVEKLDREGLAQTLARASVVLSGHQFRRDLLVPLLHQIGERWQQGDLRITHEHLAAATVRSFLTTFERTPRQARSGPVLIITTLSGQLHELGALLVATTATEMGWNAIYLGPDLPAEEIAAAVQQAQAQVVALSLVYPAHDPRLESELHRLRQLLGSDIKILVGGRVAATYSNVLKEISATRMIDLDQLRNQLETMTS
ncbi:MAG: cobalamin-dependent protein [bacterium]